MDTAFAAMMLRLGADVVFKDHPLPHDATTGRAGQWRFRLLPKLATLEICKVGSDGWRIPNTRVDRLGWQHVDFVVCVPSNESEARSLFWWVHTHAAEAVGECVVVTPANVRARAPKQFELRCA